MTKTKTKKEETTKKTEIKKKNKDKRIQPELNLALVGHVDHGKTTLTERLSGKWTDTHSEELKKGITIRLGYADFSIFFCEKCDYYTTKESCPRCKRKTTFLRKISLVDAPGHESLMATMLSGAAIVEGALLLIAANEKCPQPQTREHLMALRIANIKKIIVVQNKIDLVSREEALKNYRQIKELLEKTGYSNSPIIPLSARAKVNIDLLIKTIQEYFPTPSWDLNKDPLMIIARSFDVNKPGVKPEKLVGGVLGGAVKQGVFKKGQQIEILPGYAIEEKHKKIWKPLRTEIVQIFSGGEPVEEIFPGGSLALSTTLDPAIVKADSLAGSLVGLPGKLPPLRYQVVLETFPLERVVGLKEEIEVKPFMKKEVLMLNVNSAVTIGVITDLKKKEITCHLKKPLCAYPGERITLSRRIGDRFRLIGYGILKDN